MTMITPSYLAETIEYSSLHACRSTLEDPTDLRMMLCSSFALACPTVPVRGRRVSNTKSLVSGVYSSLWSHPLSEPRVAKQTSDQVADADQGIVFRLIWLSEAYLCAIEDEALVTLRYWQKLPLTGNKSCCKKRDPSVRAGLASTIETSGRRAT